MQLPHHPLRTYREYKLFEKEVLDWIESAASEIQYDRRDTGDALTPPPTPKPVKLKGRARTEARRKKQQASSTVWIDVDDTYDSPKFGLFDILAPVEAIAADARIKQVPTNIGRKLLKVLNLRQRCVSWYERNTEEDDKETLESNNKHLYPVRLLRKVITVLRHKLATPAISSNDQKIAESQHDPGKATDDTEKATTAAANLFEHLKLDEEIEDSLHAFAPPTDANSLKRDHQVRPSADDRAQDDYDLARYCFYEDVQEVEDHVVLELIRYAIDQGNSDTLPFTITTAVDLVSQMYILLHERKDAGKLYHNFEYPSASRQGGRKINSPLARLQGIITMELTCNMAIKSINQRDHRDCCLGKACTLPAEPFPRTEADLEYLTADSRRQWHTESNYIYSLWTEDTPSNPKDFQPLEVDAITKCLHMLKFAIKKENALHIPVGPAFGIRICLLATIILQEHKDIAFRTLQ